CAGALAVVVLALLLTHAVASNRRAARMIGVTASAERALEVVEVLPDGPAGRAGVEAGDRIVAVAGERLRDWPHYDRVALGFRAGEPVDMVLERDGTTVVRTVTPGLPVRWGREL